jgi:hypothetical protein
MISQRKFSLIMRISAVIQMFVVLSLVCASQLVHAADPVAPAAPLATAPSVVVSALIQERGTKTPLRGINVYCFPGDDLAAKPEKGTTDQSGRVTVHIPAGRFRWVVTIPNYTRLEVSDEQDPTSANPARTLYLEKTSYLVYQTTVYGEHEKRDDKTKSLDQAQFLTVPGANGDPVKAVQNLPGVNRANAFSSQVIIEGSSPNDTRYDIDNQNVPLIFHFGGLSSVVIPEAIDHVDYLSAGFGPEFGQSTAGLVNLTVKDPETDRLHSFVYADLFNAGGLIQGAINDHSSYLFGARQSYIGFVLGAVLKNNKDLSLTVVPDFRDTVLEYRNQLNAQDTFKVVAVGSMDSLGFAIKQPPEQDPTIRGNLSNETDFYRIIPEWTHKFDATKIARLSFGVGQDSTEFSIGDYYNKASGKVLTTRAELEQQINSYWKSYVGLDSILDWQTVDFQLPASTTPGGGGGGGAAGSLKTVSNTYATDATSLYWRNSLHDESSKWTWLPGLRLSYFNLTNEIMPEPRLGAKYALNGGWNLRSSTGLYDEAPPLQDLDPNYGNKDLKSQRAIHVAVGFEKDFREGSATGWTVTDDVFYKSLYNVVSTSSKVNSSFRPEYYNNSGYGDIYGMEVLAKYKTPKWEGWISYTISKSLLGSDEAPETVSTYDQTHIFTGVGDINFGKNWKFSGRIRYVTGNPYTPDVGGIFDSDGDKYTPIRGSIYSERMGSFFQADIRLDKKWIYDTWILTGYLDVENVTNRQNPQQINYSYDYSQQAVVTGLPILPTLGIKGEF